MKKINIPLVVGLIIVLTIIFLIFFGEYLAPHDASVGEPSMWVENHQGERELKRSPFAPDSNYLLGTDNGGRDILSVIMAGAKNTFSIVFIAALFRFLIAIPIAFFAAFGNKLSKKLIVIFSSTFSAVPSLLICIMILKIDAIESLNLGASMLAFIIVFTIVGWGRLASTLEEKIKDILNEDFIQGEIAIGKSKLAIATQNVSAHIMPWIIIYIFLEIAFILLLLAQLGIFDIFVGNKQVNIVRGLGELKRMNFNFFPEWGAMLAATKQSIVGNRFWLSFYPLLAFSISIVGFNLLGQGLNYELNKRNSRFISYVKKLWFNLSPKTFLSDIKHFRKKRMTVIVKSFAVLAIILAITIPTLNTLAIEDADVMSHVVELSHDKYEGRLIGTPGHDLTREYIVNQLKEYNIEPLFNDNSYISDFNIDSTINIINNSQFIITDNNNEIINELKYKIDYYFETWASNSIDRIQGEIITSNQFIAKEYDPTKEYLLVLSPNINEYSLYEQIVTERKDYGFIKGILIPDKKQVTFFSKRIELETKGLTRVLDNVEAYSNGIPPITINIGKRAANRIWNLAGNKISIENRIDNNNGLIGKNIGGIIKGKNPENPIVIVADYDYLGVHDTGLTPNVENLIIYKGLYENGTSIAGSLELAKNLGDIMITPNRSIIFLFIDGSKVTIEGLKYIEKLGVLDHNPLLVYLRYMGINKWNRSEDSLYHYTVLNNTESNIEQEFHRWIRRNSARSDYYIIEDNLIRERSIFNLGNKEIVGIVLQGLKDKEKVFHVGLEQSSLEEVDVIRLRTHIQYLLDSISDIAYGKRLFR